MLGKVCFGRCVAAGSFDVNAQRAKSVHEASRDEADDTGEERHHDEVKTRGRTREGGFGALPSLDPAIIVLGGGRPRLQTFLQGAGTWLRGGRKAGAMCNDRAGKRESYGNRMMHQ